LIKILAMTAKQRKTTAYHEAGHAVCDIDPTDWDVR